MIALFAAAALALSHDAIVDRYCQEVGVSQSLVRAVIQTESGGNAAAVTYAAGYAGFAKRHPELVSRHGLKAVSSSYGLMQIMLPTARGYLSDDVSPRRLLDAETNIRVGVRHLKNLIDKYNGNLRAALSAYNGGGEAGRRYANKVIIARSALRRAGR
ncbi:hypothetical protein FACS1894216_00980 [Synergistales bacterium]|nr:hypothetical protein FACS1894216_00980 [Synergistales bacterium]